MSTYLMRFSGPCQAYGSFASGTRVRDTLADPTKSAVIGLLCAALGKSLSEPDTGEPSLSELTALRMGVRVEREGIVFSDYQVAGAAGGIATASGASGRTVASDRLYLADAIFLVGLEGPEPLLRKLHAAIMAPYWPLYLGRRNCPPGLPVRLPDGGMRALPLETALREEVWPSGGTMPARYIIDAEKDFNGIRYDLPLDFASRRFGARRVREFVA